MVVASFDSGDSEVIAGAAIAYPDENGEEVEDLYDLNENVT